jgi:hypothetical protein
VIPAVVARLHILEGILVGAACKFIVNGQAIKHMYPQLHTRVHTSALVIPAVVAHLHVLEGLVVCAA